MEEKKHVGGTLSFKDVIAVVSVAVSMALGWGVFSTRMALVEQQLVAYREEQKRSSIELRELNDKLRALELTISETRYKMNDHLRSLPQSRLPQP